jgi:hypothetical protein
VLIQKEEASIVLATMIAQELFFHHQMLQVSKLTMPIAVYVVEMTLHAWVATVFTILEKFRMCVVSVEKTMVSAPNQDVPQLCNVLFALRQNVLGVTMERVSVISICKLEMKPFQVALPH